MVSVINIVKEHSLLSLNFFEISEGLIQNLSYIYRFSEFSFILPNDFLFKISNCVLHLIIHLKPFSLNICEFHLKVAVFLTPKSDL